MDAADPSRPPRIWVDARGQGDFAGAVPGTGGWEDGRCWCDAEPTFDLTSPGGGRFPYSIDVSYQGGTGEGAGRIHLEPRTWLRGRAVLGGRAFDLVLREASAEGSYSDVERLQVVFDRDGDGWFDADERTGEGYRGGERFNLGTGTFRVRSAAADGSSVTFAPAWPPKATRPFLGTGSAAPSLPPTDLDGRPVAWEEFRGRKVYLVFWASW